MIEGKTMMMDGSKPLRIAVVGLGMGESILETAVAHPHAQVVAICDPLEERLQSMAEHYHVPHAFADYDTMLAADLLDGVCISTPNWLHAPMVHAAVNRGLHVFCEKPLTLDIRSAEELLGHAREAGVVHGLNFSNRPNPAVHFVKEQINSGALGRINEIHLAYLQDWLVDPHAPYSWRCNKAQSGSGALGDIGSHMLDLARFFVGEVSAVQAHLATVTCERAQADGTIGIVDVDDVAYVHLTFADGLIGQLRVSRVAYGYSDYRCVHLFGEKASLILEIDTRWARVLQADQPSTFKGTTFREVFTHHAHWSSWGGNVTAWIDAAREGQAMSPDFEDGVRCQQIIDAALRSHDEGRWVSV